MPPRDPETGRLLPSPVHPPELNAHLTDDAGGGTGLHASDLAETFRHSGWRRGRNMIYQSLRRTMQTRTRIEAFSGCGATAYIYRTVDPPHKYRLGGSSCHDRFCTPCAADRSRCMAHNVLEQVAEERARFATLTLKHSDTPLREQLDRLYSTFRKLRARPFWKRHVTGGAAFIEIKWISGTQQWHPHLHCVLQGRYLPKELLRAEWLRLTGDSYITDIRLIENRKKIAYYVTKYAAKTVNSSFVGRPELLDEVVLALRGRRLAHTFGAWRGLRLTESPNERDWECIGSFHDVCLAALGGDAESCDAIDQACGERAEEVLSCVRKARPPPVVARVLDRQLTFVWPAIDNRF